MKKFIALSAAFMAVSVMASAQQPVCRPMSNRAASPVSRTSAKQMAGEPQFMQFSKQDVAPFAAPTLNLNKKNAVRRNATAATSPFYTMQGFLEPGVWYYEEQDAFGYSYYSCLPFGSAYTTKFVPQTSYSGCTFTVQTSSSTTKDYSYTDLDNLVSDESGDYFSTSCFPCPWASYCPKLTLKSKSYTYGDLGKVSSSGTTTPQNSIFYLSNGETMSLGAYEYWSGATMYSGYTNTPAYGSYNYYTSEDTPRHIQSNTLVIDMGYLHGFVLDNVQIPCLNHEDYENLHALSEGDTLTVTLYDFDENDADAEPKVYNAIATIDNLHTDTYGWDIVTIKFTEIDEDGFESEISPVIYGHGMLKISGFMKEGMSFAIPMIYREDGTSDAGDEFGTHAMFDIWIDGVQRVDEDGSVYFAATDYTDAVVNFNGRFSYIGDANGNFAQTGYISDNSTWYTAEDGTKYTIAVSQVYEGEEYNDFDMVATDSFDDWTFEADLDKVYGLGVDSTYLDNYGIYMIFVYVSDQLAEGESTTVNVYDNGEVCSTITISNVGAAGIKAVQKDVKKEDAPVYNLQGIKVNGKRDGLKPGFYVVDGKKVVL